MLSPWENAKLIGLYEKDIPRPEVFHAFIPLSGDYSDERLRGLKESPGGSEWWAWHEKPENSNPFQRK